MISTSDCFPNLSWIYQKCLSHLHDVSRAYGCTLIPKHRPCWAKIFDFWITCEVEMMPSHHGWGWYPPQTASHIHVRHIQCVWAIGILSQGHMDAPLYCYTSKFCPRFLNWGCLWSENDAITWWLRLTSTSDYFPHPCKTYKMCLGYCFAISRAYGCTLITLYSSVRLKSATFNVQMCPVKMLIVFYSDSY